MVRPDKRFTARKPIKVHQAIAWISDMGGKSHEAVRKPWNNASQNEKDDITQRFMASKGANFT